MHLPTFDDATNTNGYRWTVKEEYQVDFSTNSHRRFKEEIQGVRVYENGLVEIAPYVYRHPDLRYQLRSKYNMEFLNPYEVRGFKYFSPERKLVRKDWVEREFYLYDFRHNMMVRTPACFYGDHARLIGEPIRIAEYRKADGDAFRAKHQPLFDLAASFSAVSNEELWRRQMNALPFFHNQLPEDLELAIEQHKGLLYWLGEQQRRKQLDVLIRNQVRVRYEVPFLYFKKEGG